MKIKVLFRINVALFLLLAAATILSKQTGLLYLLVPVTFSLAALLTQWWMPLTCGKVANYFIKTDRPRYGELVARFGVAIGRPWDAQYSQFINMPRHLTPTFNCSNYLRIALLTQGKFTEMQKVETENLRQNKEEGGTVEGSGKSKSQMAATMHRTGSCPDALILINEGLRELAQTRFETDHLGASSEEYLSGRKKINAAQTLTALFTRANILESIRRYDEALVDRQKALTLAKETFGDPSKQITSHMVMLGKLFLKRKEFESANPLLHQALELRLKYLEPKDKLINSAQLSLSEYYSEIGDFANAEKYFKPAFAAALKREKTSPGPATVEYYQARAFLSQREKKIEEASKYFKMAKDGIKKYYPENNTINYELNKRMIEFLRSVGRTSETEPLERENAIIEAVFEEAGKHVS